MYKGSDIIGKPIVASAGGKIVAKVNDIVYDAKTSRVLALLVDEGGLFGSAKVVPIKNIKAIGPDAVMVDEEAVIIPADQNEAIEAILADHKAVKGLKVLTEGGKDLGTILDLYFSPESEMVTGYEVSGGLFADAYTGRSFLPAPQALRIGEDVAIVPDETEMLMNEQVGGIKGAAQQAASKLQESGKKAGEKLAEYSDKAKESGQKAATNLRERTEDFRVRADQLLRDKSVDYALGRRAHSEVRGNDGRLIVAAGQIVGAPEVQAARDMGQEQDLLKSVLQGEAKQIQGQASDWSSKSQGELGQAAQEVKQAAGDVWERLKIKAKEVKEQTTQDWEERRIKGALGRTVDRVILDTDDSVILDRGEMITHQVVDRAREAGILDVLLDSVEKEPTSPSSVKGDIHFAGQK